MQGDIEVTFTSAGVYIYSNGYGRLYVEYDAIGDLIAKLRAGTVHNYRYDSDETEGAPV